METSKLTKTDLTGRLNEAAVTERPAPRPNTLHPSDVVTARPPIPRPPLAPQTLLFPFYFNLLLLLITIEAAGQSDVSKFAAQRPQSRHAAAQKYRSSRRETGF